MPRPLPPPSLSPKPSKPAASTVPDAALQARLQSLGDLVVQHLQSGDFATAYAFTEQALELAPGHPSVLGDAGLCQLRMEDYPRAQALFEQACAAQPDNANLWDGLTEAWGHLGNSPQVLRCGLRALQLKDAQAQASRVPRPMARLEAPVPPFVPDRRRNCIAFSLFGDSPRYLEMAVLNAQEALQWFAHWTCRFYVDRQFPEAVAQRLRALQAEVLVVDEATQRDLNGLMWRFLVADDPAVQRFLVRDADSLLSVREAVAVQQWLHSGCHFHAMRDYFSHTELLLAGMWGGCGGVLEPLRPAMLAFQRSGQYLARRSIDQAFLRMCVWPQIKPSLFTHDSVFRFGPAHDFPPHAPHGLGPSFHVGANLAFTSIQGQSDLADGQPVRWQVIDASGAEVCSYTSAVQQGHWSAPLPQPYIERLQAGQWAVRVLPAQAGP